MPILRPFFKPFNSSNLLASPLSGMNSLGHSISQVVGRMNPVDLALDGALKLARDGGRIVLRQRGRGHNSHGERQQGGAKVNLSVE